jgi:exodeoxyribonuclease VII small subunit
MSETTNVTFENGYRRLQDISERVNSDEVPVHEMCDLFAEGKGLATALTSYLDEQKARVEAIERGDEIHAFRVVAPSGEAGGGETENTPGDDVPPQLTGPDEIPF